MIKTFLSYHNWKLAYQNNRVNNSNQVQESHQE